MPKVYNYKYDKALCDQLIAEGKAVYIGRGRGSKWGNQWTHIQSGNHQAEFVVPTIQDAVKAHAEWLYKFFNDYEAFDEYVEGLENKDMVCWCTPKGGLDPDSFYGPDPCHGLMLMRLTYVHFNVKAIATQGMLENDDNDSLQD